MNLERRGRDALIGFALVLAMLGLIAAARYIVGLLPVVPVG